MTESLREHEQEVAQESLPLLWAILVLLGTGEAAWWVLHRLLLVTP